jgi:HK97 family phage prohead protease
VLRRLSRGPRNCLCRFAPAAAAEWVVTPPCSASGPNRSADSSKKSTTASLIRARVTATRGVVCQFQHDAAFMLGSIAGGTLRLGVDATGLSYDVDVPQCRNDVLELVQRGDIAHSSFAFQTYQDDWNYADGQPVRTLLSGRLIDVAPVSRPAYSTTSVGLRSLARHVDAPIEDVVKYAEADELRKFFVRTGSDGLSGAAARAQMIRKRYPRPLYGRVAKMQMMAKRWPEWSEPEPLSGIAARARMVAMRYPRPGPKPLYGPVAKMAMMAKRWPEWSELEPLSGAAARA